MKKNRIWILAVVLVVCLGLLSGCGNNTSESGGKDDKVKIVCTTFPIYDWVVNIIGDESDRFEVTLLLDSGVDLHNYQPTAADVALIGAGDLFLYVGGESDEWVEDVMQEKTNAELVEMSLLDILGNQAKEEEVVEGMEAEEEHEEETEVEYDEHVWLSMKCAKLFVETIADEIQKVEPEAAKSYEENGSAYIDQLEKLDQEYETAVGEAKYKTLIFGDRFPFRYLADDYGLQYYAAFAGCSAETEASFSTITFLAEKVDESGVPAILTIDHSDGKIADTIRENTKDHDQNIIEMNSMQSVTKKEGNSYLGIMQDNLESLKSALND